MNKKELTESISFLSDHTKVGAELFFHYVKDNETFLLKAPTQVEQLNKKLAKNFCHSVTTIFSTQNEFEVLPITSVREVDPIITYYYYEKDIPEGLQIIFEQAKDTYSFKKHEYSCIKGFVIKLTYGEKQITLYKVKNPLDFHVKPTVMTILRMDDTFTSPSDESLILTEKFDYAVIEKKLVVMNLDQLQRKFKFEERIKLHSKSLMDSLKDKGKAIIEEEGFATLETFLSENMNFAKKIKKMDYTGVLWTTDFKVVKAAIESREKLKKYLYFNKKGDKFNIKSKMAAKLFFSLCNDLIMESILSGKVSTVPEKDEIE